MKKSSLGLILLLLTSATFSPGRITQLPYDLGPYEGPHILSQHGITLQGDGVFGEDVGITYPADSNGTTKDGTAVELRANALTLRDLVISSPRVNGSWGQQAGKGDGIVYTDESFDTWGTISGTVLDHVTVLYPGRHCLRVQPHYLDNGGHGYWVSPAIRDCNFYGSLTDGVVVKWMTDAVWDRVTSTRHKGWGFIFDDIQTSKFKIAAESLNGGIYVKNSSALVFEACHVEGFAQDSISRAGLVLDNCHGVTVQGSAFSNWEKEGAISIKLINGTTGCTILPNYHAAVKYAVWVDASCKGNVIYAQPQYNYGNPEVWGKLVVDRRKNRVIE